MKKFYSLFLLLVVAAVWSQGLWAEEEGDDYSSVSNGRPYKAGTVWYSLYDPTSHNGRGNGNDYDRKPFVYPPTAGMFYFDYHNTTPGATAISFWEELGVFEKIDRTSISASNIAFDAANGFVRGESGGISSSNYSSDGWHDISHTSHFYYEGDNFHHYQHEISRWISEVSLRVTDHGTPAYYAWRSQNLQIRMARHLRLENGTAYGTDHLRLTGAQTEVHQSSQLAPVYFRSFLTNGADIVITPDSGDIDQFSIAALQPNEAYTISIPDNSCGVYAKVTGDQTELIDASQAQYGITINFRPTTVGEKAVRFLVSNGGNSVYVTVRAEAIYSSDVLAVADLADEDGSESTITYNLANHDYGVNTANYRYDLRTALNIHPTLDYATASFVEVENSDYRLTTAGLLTVYHHGVNIEFDVEATSPYHQNAVTKHFVLTGVPYGTMTFLATTDNQYTTLSNWDRTDILPTEHQNVLINGACVLSDTRRCHDFTVGTGSLVINKNATLDVENRIASSDATRLRIKADAGNMGTLRFLDGTDTRATVESYLRGIYAGGDLNQVDWQYRGAVGTPDAIVWSDVNVYRWDEAYNATNCWRDIQRDNITLQPWLGYAVDNHQAERRVVEYTTQLVGAEGGHTFALTLHQSGKANEGVNLITNSYSAPVTIADMQFNGAQQELYFYNTASHAQWEAQGGSVTGMSRQIQTYPVHTGAASGMSPNIAAGQSFAVRAAQDGASLTIPETAVSAEMSPVMHAPAEQPELNVLRINLSEDSETVDRLTLVESALCTDGYDDGFDGTKMFSAITVPAIYAYNSFGNTSVNSSVSMLDQQIGFHAGRAETEYTVTFDTDDLTGYETLYFVDNETGVSTDILAGGSYSFYGTTGLSNRRFSIRGSRIINASESVTTDERTITVADNQALLRGFDAAETVTVTDMQGRVVMTRPAGDELLIDLSSLLRGAYVIRVADCSVKFIR